MNQRKICVVITARPSYSRVKTVLQAILDNPQLELQLVVSGSAILDRYGRALRYIEKDGFKVSEKVFNVIEGEDITSSAKTTGLGVLELSSVFSRLIPDIVVTVADRYETMATAIAASYMNIPLAHIQGGEVTGNIDEKVRHSITKLADYHFVASDDALNRVIKLGENPDYVFNTGCPSIDIARQVLHSPELTYDPLAKYGGVGSLINMQEDYIVVMQHPVTTEYHMSKTQVQETLDAIVDLNLPTFWFWPNVDMGSSDSSKVIRSFREANANNNIRFFKNMEPSDFLGLLINSKCLIGNSSVGIRECSYLGVPVVNIGTRQNRRVRSVNVVDVDYDKNQIKEAVRYWFKKGKPSSASTYGDGNAGLKIASILANVPLTYIKTISY